MIDLKAILKIQLCPVKRISKYLINKKMHRHCLCIFLAFLIFYDALIYKDGVAGEEYPLVCVVYREVTAY